MNQVEERFVLNSELGKAIAQWGYVEGQLLRIVQRCTQDQGDKIAAPYLSIDNMRAKLIFIDSLIHSTIEDAACLRYWSVVLEKCRTLSSKRNALAHGWHSHYPTAKGGKRFAIIPQQQSQGTVIHTRGEKAPPGAIFVLDVIGYRYEFHALTQQICNLFEMLCGRQAPFPEADEQVRSPPTFHHLENQMRAELGRQPKPSRKKPTKETP